MPRYLFFLRKALIRLIVGRTKFYHLEAIEREELSLLDSVKSKNEVERCVLDGATDIYEHLTTLFLLIIEKKAKTIVELGTRNGESTIALVEGAKKTNGKVFSFDLDPCLEAKKRIKSLNLDSYWSFKQSNSLDVDWKSEIDHLFIDSSHKYSETLAELKKFEPYVRNGGVITLHDIVTCPEVMNAMDKYFEKRSDIMIYRFFNNHGLAVIVKNSK
jgi:predicted O-methyltransferase YrrM|tara:strand:+ start:2179 stop:2826 length:648 start_codon:yes stop_codon:yes gene_type:complete